MLCVVSNNLLVFSSSCGTICTCNTLKIYLKFSQNTLQSALNHLWTFLKTSLKLPWHYLETSFKFFDISLKLIHNTLKTSLIYPYKIHPWNPLEKPLTPSFDIHVEKNFITHFWIIKVPFSGSGMYNFKKFEEGNGN